MSGFGAALYDFDNDGWKDIFVTRGDVVSLRPMPGTVVDQVNTVFRNLGSSGKWQAYTEEAGFERRAARHRGCALGTWMAMARSISSSTALGKPAEIWMNRSHGKAHWLDIALEGTGAIGTASVPQSRW